MEKFVHIEARTIIEIPTFGGMPTIHRYQPDNPLHDPTTCKIMYSVYGKRNGMFEILADCYEFNTAYELVRALSNKYQATFTDHLLVEAVYHD